MDFQMPSVDGLKERSTLKCPAICDHGGSLAYFLAFLRTSNLASVEDHADKFQELAAKLISERLQVS